MMRHMCVWFPRWPWQHLRHVQPELERRAVVWFAEACGRRVVVCAPAAEACGVRPGMPLAEARSVLEAARRRGGAGLYLPYDAVAQRQALQRLAAECHRFSPLVALEPCEAADASRHVESLLLHVVARGPDWNNEAELLHAVCGHFRHRGFSLRAAVADTPGAAWGVCHYGPQEQAVVPAGQQMAALRPLPIEALRLEASAVAMLHELGIGTVGQLEALPRDGLRCRFGPRVLQRLDQALGALAEPLVPLPQECPIEAAYCCETPLSDRQSLAAIVRRLVLRLVEQLRARHRGVQQLRVCLKPESGQGVVLRVGLLQASDVPSHLQELILAQMERAALPAEVAEVRLTAEITAVLRPRQTTLLDGEEQHVDRHELATLLERIANRLGRHTVLGPQPAADHQPEYACRYEPLLGVDAAVGNQCLHGLMNPWRTAAWDWPPPSAAEETAASGTAASEMPASEMPASGTAASRGSSDFCGHSPARGQRRQRARSATGGAARAGSQRQASGGEDPFCWWQAVGRFRPLCLLAPPVRVEVLAPAPEGPPAQFRWQQCTYRVIGCWGPERIETGWWRGEMVRRDYYGVDTQPPGRFWLFRHLDAGGWFLHGLFE
jgi:protein ImuB